MHQHFITDKQVGEKFMGHVYAMAKEEPVIEKNAVLQKRISDAAKHFDSRLSALLESVKKHPLITEHREASAPVDEALKELALAVYATHYYLQYCRQPFALNAYLKHKLAYAQPRFSITVYASGKKQNLSGIVNAELFETLKRWRDMVFEETALPIYMIANAEALKALSTCLPLNKKDLIKIKGFGKAKVDKYGDDIIEMITDYCEKYGLQTNMQANTGEERKERTPSNGKAQKIDTKALSFDLYKQGKSIAAIAEERKLTSQTIEGHLSHYIESGVLSVNELLSDEKQQKITVVYKQNKEASFSDMKEQLPDISFGEIRMMMAAVKYESSGK